MSDRELTAAPMLSPYDWEAIVSGTEEPFSRYLLRIIDERGLKDSAVYTRANIDRKLFSKIRCDPAYHPRKATVVALCLALQLDRSGADALLSKAGFTLTPALRQDVVIAFCIEHGIYDVNSVNTVLFDLDLPLLGA